MYKRQQRNYTQTLTIHPLPLVKYTKFVVLEDHQTTDEGALCSLLLVLRIYEISSHRHQLVLLGPFPHTSPFLAPSPMLAILRLAKVQRLRGTVLRRKYEEHVAMLSSLWRWAWRLVLDDIIQTALLLHFSFHQAELGQRQNREGLG
jgi:hypothetical protein